MADSQAALHMLVNQIRCGTIDELSQLVWKIKLFSTDQDAISYLVQLRDEQ